MSHRMLERGATRTADQLLGELERAIMRRMWAQSTASVREILIALHAAGRPLAYTTVMTVMGRLTTKGLLSRELVGKAHVYRAAMTEEQFLRAEAARQVQALVREFGDLAMAEFVAEFEDLAPARRRQLERLARGEEA